MSDYTTYIFIFIFGLLLGLIYFGGLWLTIAKLRTTPYPVLFSLASFWARILITGLVFFQLSRGGNWISLLVCLAGFIAIRVILVYRLGRHELETRRL